MCGFPFLLVWKICALNIYDILISFLLLVADSAKFEVEKHFHKVPLNKWFFKRLYYATIPRETSSSCESTWELQSICGRIVIVGRLLSNRERYGT
ncbi:hypothetical protein IFM89_034714 [Coptis chinensis]|uniref:Uncharacterized protein n=1 Tax=Coptis chinensis TaxID=261450 RepID=A0A835LPF3_9MAGN|nr:hypothetical protein IFM89_034714 [Coptis chinensis]